jgi:hypothetical protein
MASWRRPAASHSSISRLGMRNPLDDSSAYKPNKTNGRNTKMQKRAAALSAGNLRRQSAAWMKRQRRNISAGRAIATIPMRGILNQKTKPITRSI